MKTKRHFGKQIQKFALCDLSCNKPHERAVQPGLSLSPQDVKNLTDKGLATSTPNASFYDDEGVSPVDFFIEPQYRRGFDLNTAWAISKATEQKIIDVHKRDSLIYG